MIPWWEITLRLLFAGLIGGVIGWERERRAKPAGLRTHILVSAAAATYVLAAEQVALLYGEPVDAMRAMAGIAGGVGFMGAGVILRSKGEVRLLTTAAALWADAALGLAAGLGMYYIGALATVIVLVVLELLPALEHRSLKEGKAEEPDIEDQDSGELSDD